MNRDISILIADDIRSNRVLLKRILEKAQFVVREAENGVQALEIAQSGDVDIALLDVMMPEMDGFEVCRRLRKSYSPTELPILFITAKVEDADLQTGFSAGGNDYITKPITSTVVMARLMSQVRLLRASRALVQSYEQLAKKRRMESVGVFASGVAHNFNNILGTVLGSSELIELYSDDEDIKHSCRLIISAAKRGALLVDNLLTFARPSETDCCSNPVEILRSVAEVLPSENGKNIDIHLDIIDELPPLALSTDALAQVFIELIRNSAEAISGNGEIRIRADVINDKSGSGAAAFLISDTGGGISSHIQEHLFEPFFSTKNLDARMGISLDGSGLGLSTVYNLITKAQGSIQLLESSEKGTTFELILPAADDTASTLG